MNNVAVNPPLSSLQPSTDTGATVTNPLPQISTNQNQNYFMQSFMGTVNVAFDDGAGTEWLDILDPNVESFMEAITTATPALDNVAIPITTVVFRHYQTTSLWWFYLMFNGVMHPLKRVGGQRMYFPNATQISQYANELNSIQSNITIRGTVVTA